MVPADEIHLTRNQPLLVQDLIIHDQQIHVGVLRKKPADLVRVIRILSLESFLIHLLLQNVYFPYKKHPRSFNPNHILHETMCSQLSHLYFILTTSVVKYVNLMSKIWKTNAL